MALLSLVLCPFPVVYGVLMFRDSLRCPGFCLQPALKPKKKAGGNRSREKTSPKKNKQQKVNKQHYNQQHHTAARFKPER